MTKAEMKEYVGKQPVAVYPMSNWGGLEILDIIYGVDDYAVARYNFGEPESNLHKVKINYDASGNPFVVIDGNRIRLDECMRI